ncbi:hypothetical protein GDO81_017949 [Engystomops pustulosus]|uniref:Uncharacterized protein n=1 Tax=Engystomops pustulosus TaxID=76066 RepID=A0AAV7A4J9_ENGPU|nr:hypothetical protein GDO81_017949 [Engystomops pustulosus]
MRANQLLLEYTDNRSQAVQNRNKSVCDLQDSAKVRTHKGEKHLRLTADVRNTTQHNNQLDAKATPHQAPGARSLLGDMASYLQGNRPQIPYPNN